MKVRILVLAAGFALATMSLSAQSPPKIYIICADSSNNTRIVVTGTTAPTCNSNETEAKERDYTLAADVSSAGTVNDSITWVSSDSHTAGSGTYVLNITTGSFDSSASPDCQATPDVTDALATVTAQSDSQVTVKTEVVHELEILGISVPVFETGDTSFTLECSRRD